MRHLLIRSASSGLVHEGSRGPQPPPEHGRILIIGARPGVNGFADGVVYVPSKDGFVYALNLTTGAHLWTASLGS